MFSQLGGLLVLIAIAVFVYNIVQFLTWKFLTWRELRRFDKWYSKLNLKE